MDTRMQVAVTLLTALAETKTGETREGIAYAGLMGICRLDEFQEAVGALVGAGYLRRGTQFLLVITAEGREAAARIEAKLAGGVK